MKPTFKTTALAILVSLGAVACSSTSPSNNQQPKQVQPTNPNSQSKPNAQDKSKKSEAEQNAEEEKAKAEREAQQKAAEQKRLEEEAKIKAEEAKKAKDLEEKARLEREAKEKAEEAKRLEEERIKAEEKAKLEEENRQRLERERLEKEKQSSVDARVKSELDKMPKTSDGKIKAWGNGWIDEENHIETLFGYSFSSFPVVTRLLTPDENPIKVLTRPNPGEDRVPLSEITANDIQKGGKYLGVHEGSYTTKTVLPKVIELDDKSFEHGSDKLIIKKADYNNKDVNYLFINNPYSSYGALFVDQHRSELFAQPLFGAGSDSDFLSGSYMKGNTSYNNESLQGKTFTYKGNIIARTVRAIPKTNVIVSDEPKIDGDITFKIEFEKRVGSRMFDGVINSKVLGNNIKFNMHHDGAPAIGKFIDYKTYEKPFDPDYNYNIDMGAEITDKNATDVVGFINYSIVEGSHMSKTGRILNPTYFDEKEERRLHSDDIPKNGLIKYQGVFGATKQPE